MVHGAESGCREGDLADGDRWGGGAWSCDPNLPAAWIAAGDPPQRPRWLAGPWIAVLSSMLGAVVIIGTLTIALGGSDDARPTAGTVPQYVVTVPQVPSPEPVPATFDPIVLTGTGEATEPIAVPAGAGDVIVTAEYSGSGNFVVWALDQQLLRSELAVNQIGSYRGSSVIAATAAALQIEAEGPWTVTVHTLDEAPTFDRVARGTGSAVLHYTGEQGIATLATEGPGSFSVTERADTFSSRLLVNQVGPYSGQHIISAGPSILIIEADGDWELTLE